MRVISRKALIKFYSVKGNADAKGPCEAWFSEAKKADWTKPQDIKDRYATASFLGDERVVFNIGGNKYRLVVVVLYDAKQVLIRFIGTHANYDRINAEKV